MALFPNLTIFITITTLNLVANNINKLLNNKR